MRTDDLLIAALSHRLCEPASELDSEIATQSSATDDFLQTPSLVDEDISGDTQTPVAATDESTEPKLESCAASGEIAGGLYGPTLRTVALLSRAEEEALGETIHESRMEMTRALCTVPAAVAVICELMREADAGERPITDALFAPFEHFEGFESRADADAGGDDPAASNWRRAAHAMRALLDEWRALHASGAPARKTDAARRRLTAAARSVQPGFVALADALEACRELDRRVAAIERRLGAFHADIVDRRTPSDDTLGAFVVADDASASSGSDWQAGRRTLLAVEREAGVDLTTLRDCCEIAAARYARYSRARDRMVTANLRLAHFVAYRLRGAGLAIEDLVQEATLGLMRAVDKFDYRLGYKFSTYALQWIRQSTTRAIADASRTIRVPGHVHDDIVRLRKLGRPLEQRLGREPTPAELAGASGMPERKVRQAQRFARAIDELLEALPPRDALVVRLRLGIGGGEPRTLEEVGTSLGITRERTRQLEARAMNRLREIASPDLLEEAEL